MARKKADDINLKGFEGSDYDALSVSDTDYSECSVSGADNVLQESASDNKKIFDAFPKIVAAKLNGLINKLKGGNFVQDAKYVHTDNNYTTAEKNKLTKIEGGAQVNVIESVKVNGSALSVSNKSVDVSVPTKLSELNNDGNFVKDSNYVHTDNNFTDEYIWQIESNYKRSYDALSIAQGANRAVCFKDYREMIDFFNSNPNWGESIFGSDMEFKIGQNIYIGTVGVPDLWIASIGNIPPVNYTYTTDKAFVNDLNTALANGEFLQVGYVTLGILETQKVDLTNYVVNDNSYKAMRARANHANQTVVFANYEELIEHFSFTSNLSYAINMDVGQTILIEDPNVPDLWVAKTDFVNMPGEDYIFANGEEFLAHMEENNGAWVGCYLFCAQKNGFTYYKNGTDYLNALPGDVYRLSPNYPEVSISLIEDGPINTVKEYYFSVDTASDAEGNVIPSIQFEGVTKWATPFEINADTHYEIAIRNGYGVIAEFSEVS